MDSTGEHRSVERVSAREKIMSREENSITHDLQSHPVEGIEGTDRSISRATALHRQTHRRVSLIKIPWKDPERFSRPYDIFFSLVFIRGEIDTCVRENH